MARQHAFNPRAQAGVSLVEIMVSLAIGLVVIGAVFANYLSNNAGTRHAAAMAQITEDGALALGILRNHLGMAGFSQPESVSGAGIVRRLGGPAVVGCEHGFENPKAADIATLSCIPAGNAAASSSDALLVRYEADRDSVPEVEDTGTGGQAPADCAGTALEARATGYFLADNRFTVGSNPTSLTCLGNGNTAEGDAQFSSNAMPLVNNVVQMRLRYGVAIPDAATGQLGPIARYVTASGVGLPTDEASWRTVAAVRVCVVVRSESEVLDTRTAYRDCDDTVRTPTDRRIYRAFTSTVMLNNARVPSTS